MKSGNTILGVCYLYLMLIMVSGCKSIHEDITTWNHEMKNTNTPWTHEKFDDGKDKFSFAIISDLWGGYREGIIDVAIDQLNLLRPELVLSVGDLIDGGTEDVSQLNVEWNHFESKVNQLKAPFFHVGGNHDLTNITMRQVWEEHFGKRYYHFIYKNVLFLILDSEDYKEERMQEIYKARAIAIEILDGDNPELAVQAEYFKMPERRTGEISAEQSNHFKTIIQKNIDVSWTFILMHKPVWMRDNEGGLLQIEKALQGRPYTVVNGHFHTYNHINRMNRDYITMGTTGGSQNDQSNMAFDHMMWVTVDEEGPTIANLKLEGILNKYGQLPARGDTLCFQASKCIRED